MLIMVALRCLVLTGVYYHAFSMQGKPKEHFSTLLQSLSNVISVPFFPSQGDCAFFPSNLSSWPLEPKARTELAVSERNLPSYSPQPYSGAASFTPPPPSPLPSPLVAPCVAWGF